MADGNGSLLGASCAACLAAAGVAWAMYRRTPVDTSIRSLNVVVTGSTRGLGFALARHHLLRGDSVVLSSRTASAVESARAALTPVANFPGQKLVGHVCDVASPSGCDSLASEAKRALGGIDLWINNAGATQHPKAPLADTPVETIQSVVGTNLLGTIFGCRAALRVMLEQGHGCVVNIDGRGSRGGASPQSAAYGASKAAIPQLTKSLAKELKGTGCFVHTASPGMVMTDLLLTEASPASLKIFNILAETPDTVAAWLVPRMRAATDQPSGMYLHYLTPFGVAWRFATAPWRTDQLIKVLP
ncbi:hypothetical protein AB1Y20_008412 [Prymnesium parvum]|uniref:Chlorophyll(Ide) b reductase n=1 Tax=Prymnesium parvum TaxID=97485 RepID=A0AB34ISY4_PRYPA